MTRMLGLVPGLVTAALLGACSGSGEIGDEARLESATHDLRWDNGVALNGVALNGVALNGVALNGVALNGVALNGVALNGTSLNGVALNGTSLDGVALNGATLVGTNANGGSVILRIDAVQQQADPDIWYYWISWNNAGVWTAVCPNAGPAVLATGAWNSDGSWDSKTASTQMTVACHAVGAIAKCIEWGYKPWKSVSGVSLRNHHQACTRMVRADYCGDGVAHTANGTVIDVYDSLRINVDDHNAYAYPWSWDADWGPDGTLCSFWSRLGGTAPCQPNAKKNVTFVCGAAVFDNQTLIKDWFVPR